MIDQPLMNNIPEGEGFMFPSNSYTHKCSCGVEFIAPTGSMNCHKCLYATISALRAQVESVKLNEFKSDCLVMANARRLIKAKSITSNGRLYSELFGTGCGTGRAECRKLGLDPDSNITNYNPKPPELLESEK